MSAELWFIQTLNSLSLGGLLFLLASGFSLIFGLMRVANLAHGALFMLGGYIGLTAMRAGVPFIGAVLVAGAAVGLLGAVLERLVIRKLNANPLRQVLATLGIAFIIADACLAYWGGDPQQVQAPEMLRGAIRLGTASFPLYRLAVVAVAVTTAIALWILMDKTSLGAMIRAGVDDMEMARGVGIPVSRLFTCVFCLGCALAGAGGVLGGPILSVYPGLDMDMLPLALVVVILGGIGSLGGAFIGSFVIGLVYTFGQTLIPDIAYVVLFLPMVVVLALRPRGLFGRSVS